MILPYVVDPLLHSFDLSRENSFHGDVGHVKDQYPEDKDGGGERNDGIVVGPISDNGEACQHEAEKDAARIA